MAVYLSALPTLLSRCRKTVKIWCWYWRLNDGYTILYSLLKLNEAMTLCSRPLSFTKWLPWPHYMYSGIQLRMILGYRYTGLVMCGTWCVFALGRDFAATAHAFPKGCFIARNFARLWEEPMVYGNTRTFNIHGFKQSRVTAPYLSSTIQKETGTYTPERQCLLSTAVSPSDLKKKTWKINAVIGLIRSAPGLIQSVGEFGRGPKIGTTFHWNWYHRYHPHLTNWIFTR